MKKVLLLASMLVVSFLAAAQTAPPRIFFSDLTSGPNSGGFNNKGVWVTIYGNNFGTTQGASTVTVGGGLVDNCPVWGATWLWYQKISCQLGANAVTGNIVVAVGGQASNGIPFTVRSGAIYFLSPSGSDSGAGSYAAPWKTLPKARSSILAGDTVYLRGGTYSGADYDRAVLNVNGVSGQQGRPLALVGYPGENAVINATTQWAIADTYANANWWTFAGLDIANAGDTGVYWANENTAGATNNGIRFVGNKLHGFGSCAIEFEGPSTESQWLGNDVYSFALGSASGGPRGYAFYFGGYGPQYNIEVGWNKVHDDLASSTHKLRSKFVQMYGHCPQSGLCSNRTDEFRNVVVHDNIVRGMGQNAIVMGGSDGSVNPWKDDNVQYIYNNVFIYNGATDTEYGYSTIQLGQSGTGTFKLYNNTFYWNGNSPLPGNSGDIDNMGATSIETVDNIFYAPSPAGKYCYVCYEGGGTASQMSGRNNLFYGAGSGPSWSSASVSQDPLFASPSINLSIADFHLQSGSPAIDKGVALGTVLADIAGLLRPQGSAFDLGAYEFSTGTVVTRPNPPTNLSVTIR